MPVVLTAHPKARYWKAHAILDFMGDTYRDNTIYFRIGESQLPSPDMPYWPVDMDFSVFEATSYLIAIGADDVIRIGGIDDEFTRIDTAMERILVMAKNPSLEIFISEEAEHYLQETTRYLCETTKFNCRIRYRP